MKTLRQIHLYLGCIFTPLIVYFAFSGAWQVFRFNDIPKDEPPTLIRSFLHNLSMPHTNSTLPGLSPKTDYSTLFSFFTLLMAVGMILTAGIGVALALKFGRSRKLIVLCLGFGLAVPILLLYIRST